MRNVLDLSMAKTLVLVATCKHYQYFTLSGYSTLISQNTRNSPTIPCMIHTQFPYEPSTSSFSSPSTVAFCACASASLYALAAFRSSFRPCRRPASKNRASRWRRRSSLSYGDAGLSFLSADLSFLSLAG